jgi:hypothetical protein
MMYFDLIFAGMMTIMAVPAVSILFPAVSVHYLLSAFVLGILLVFFGVLS